MTVSRKGRTVPFISGFCVKDSTTWRIVIFLSAAILLIFVPFRVYSSTFRCLCQWNVLLFFRRQNFRCLHQSRASPSVAFALLLVAETMAWKIDQAPPCQSHKSNTSITHNAAGFGRKNGQQTPNSRILDEQNYFNTTPNSRVLDEQNYFNTKSNICSEYKQQYTLILRLEFVTKQSNLYETMLHLVFVGYLPQSGNVVKIDGRNRP